MRYFDIIRGRNVSADTVNKALRCIRLSWTRGDLDAKPIPEKYFSLYPLGPLRGTVHVVEVSHELHILNEKLKKDGIRITTQKRETGRVRVRC